MTTRDDHVFRAKLAQKTNRFDIMVESMRMTVLIDAKLSEEERDLLSTAYKMTIENKRLSLRTIKCFERKVEIKGYENGVELTKDFRIEVEKEIRDICYEIIGLLDQYLIPAALTVFAKAFYLKMKGEYYKCLSEFTTGSERNGLIEKSRVSYVAASSDLWSELRCDIDVLADLYDWNDEHIGENFSKMENLSVVLHDVDTYFKQWTRSNISEKAWTAANFVFSL